MEDSVALQSRHVLLDGLAIDLEEDGPEIRLGIADAVGFVAAIN
jgi:hypothetical protein